MTGAGLAGIPRRSLSAIASRFEQRMHSGHRPIRLGLVAVGLTLAACAAAPSAVVDPSRAEGALEDGCQYVGGGSLDKLEGDAVQMWYCLDVTLTARSVAREVQHRDLAADLERELGAQGSGGARVERLEDGMQWQGESLARSTFTLVAGSKRSGRRWDVPTATAILVSRAIGERRAVYTCAAPVLGKRDALANAQNTCDALLEALLDAAPAE